MECRVFRARLNNLLLAAVLGVSAPGGLAETPASPFEDDARLMSRRSFAFRNLPVRDVLAEMDRQTGIRFFSDPVVADNRLSLTVHDRPLADTLNAIAKFYQWEWRRDAVKRGQKSAAGYTLLETSEARSAEAGYVDGRLEKLVTILRKEAEAYETFAPVDQKQRERLEEKLPTMMAQEKDSARLETLKVQSIVLQDLHERRLWKPPVYRLLRSLPPEQLSEIARSSATSFAWPAIPGCRPIPEDSIQELRRVFAQEIVPNGVPRGQIASLRLRFTLIAGRLPYLRTSLQIGQRTTYGLSTYGMLTSMPSAYTLLSEISTALPPIEPPDWKSDPTLMRLVSVRLPEVLDPKPPMTNEKPSVTGGRRASGNQSPFPYIWLTDALDMIDKAASIDVISDGLWTTRLAGIDVRTMPVGDVLTKLGRGTGHRWWEQGGFVMMQSRTLSADRWAEPPATAVSRWRDQIEHGWFGLDEYAELAALPDAQAMTLQDMSAAEQFPMFLSPLTNSRSHLLLWNALTPAQRRKALGLGLPNAELTPQQQQLFVLAATDTSASQLSSTNLDAVFFAHARLRIETQERPCWGVHRMGPFATWRIPRGSDADSAIEKREDAVHRFLASDSSIRAEDIQAMMLIVHSFQYETEKEPFSRAILQLPPRWEAN